MESDRLITIAIHTLDRAQRLKALLEREGVAATLQNVNLATPVLAAGVRVRIAESDLPLALRIIENPEIFPLEGAAALDAADNVVLVPIDFSEKSHRAIRVAFAIAAAAGSKVALLHAFLVPRANPLTSMGNSVTLDDGVDAEVEEVSASVQIAKTAREEMQRIQQSIRGEIKSGSLPAVKFSAEMLEGLPEECIGQYVKEHPAVHLLVMGTRAAEKKAADLAGSITAEVLDSCRIQTLTVPESDDCKLQSLADVKSVALLSHLEQEDFLALDALHRLLPPHSDGVAINVVCMPNDKYSRSTNEAARRALSEYCAEHFPGYAFTMTEHDKSNRDLEIGNADLLVVPNRKKNLFARLFNPGAAHRILFHTDIPLLVIPV